MKPLTPAPVVALFALACIGETSNTGTPPMPPPPHTGTVIAPMPPPRHSEWVQETGGSGGSGAHSGATTTAPRHAPPSVSPPPRTKPSGKE